MFTVKYTSGNVTFRDISSFNAALKIAFVLLAGEKLTSYSSEHYQNITVSSSNTTKVFQAWKVKSSSGHDLPEIECLRSTVEHVEEVVTSSSNNVSTSRVTISADLDRLQVSSHTPTSQQDPGDIDSIVKQLEVILEKEWGYTELRTEQKEAITHYLKERTALSAFQQGDGNRSFTYSRLINFMV